MHRNVMNVVRHVALPLIITLLADGLHKKRRRGHDLYGCDGNRRWRGSLCLHRVSSADGV